MYAIVFLVVLGNARFICLALTATTFAAIPSRLHRSPNFSYFKGTVYGQSLVLVYFP